MRTLREWADKLRIGYSLLHKRWRSRASFSVGRDQTAHRSLNLEIIRHLPWRHPKTSRQLYLELLDDYGSLNKRTFYYHLKHLVDTGRIKANRIHRNHVEYLRRR